MINHFALSSVAKIRITAEADEKSQIAVYYSSNLLKFPFTEKRSIRSKFLTKEEKSTRTLGFHNKIVKHLRIDPVKGEGRTKIYSIKILSYFGDALIFKPEDIISNFSTNSSVNMSLHEDYLEVDSTGPDPQLVLTESIKFNNPIFSYLLPFILTILSVVILSNISIKNIYAIKDIKDKKPSSAQNISALDGLRGFAALLVIAGHTEYQYFQGLGAIGVWIFFCLSGFLLSIPFVKNPSLIYSSNYLQHYMLRRISRIVPMYYFILTIVYLFRGNFESFVRHIVFVQGDGVFWSVPQEMFFYMILPIVFFLNFYLWKGNVKLMIFFTLMISILLNNFLTHDWLYIYGNGRKLTLWVGVFMTGVCLSYFYHSPYIRILTKWPKLIHNVCGISILIIVLLSSDSFLNLIFNKNIHYSWNAEIYGYIAALLLLFTISTEHSLLNKLMSLYPLRAIGIVGFSFYLIHAGVLNIVKAISLEFTGHTPSYFTLLVAGIILTYFFSVITYSLIERPFMHKK